MTDMIALLNLTINELTRTLQTSKVNPLDINETLSSLTHLRIQFEQEKAREDSAKLFKTQ